MSIQLAFEEYGSGPPLIILHGLFGSSTNWRSIAKRLSVDFRVLGLDLRNHGRSGWHHDMSYAVMANDVRNFILENDLQQVTVIGHSMGGKTAMALALTHGDLLDSLVVIDIAPVDYNHSHELFTQSMMELDLGKLINRKQAETALAKSILDTPTRQFLLQNLVSVNNQFDWRINLAAIQQNMDKLTGFPIDLHNSQFNQQTLFVHGSESDYITPNQLPQINKLFPNNKTVEIKNAGHWIHVQNPDELLNEMHFFLEQKN